MTIQNGQFAGLTEAQVAQRRQGIGGSDAGEIMLGNWPKLWRQKTGREAPEDLSDVLPAQMGHATEAFNAYWYECRTGRNVAFRGNRVVSDRYRFMVANLDGVTKTSRGEAAYWDAKHVGRLDQQTVLRYTPQMVHCCTILNLDWWVLSVFIGNSKWEMVEQEVDPLYQANLIAREQEFWGYVERDEEPPEPERVLAPKPTPKLRTIAVPIWKPDGPNEVFDALCRENNWVQPALDLISDFARTHAAATRHNIVREDLKKLVPEDVGTLTYGLFKFARDRAGAVRMTLAKGEDE